MGNSLTFIELIILFRRENGLVVVICISRYRVLRFALFFNYLENSRPLITAPLKSPRTIVIEAFPLTCSQCPFPSLHREKIEVDVVFRLDGSMS